MTKIKRLAVILIILIIAVAQTISALGFENQFEGFQPDQIANIEKFVEKQMKAGKIPGLSLEIVKGDKTIYRRGFGYSDIEKKQPMPEDALFELGSASKAFTAVGILLLERRGLLSLDDTVDKYVPFFKASYEGKDAKITIGQLIYQTSGIPAETIDKIPEGDDESALEDTIKAITGISLVSFPGDSFEYATVNYDILGLIIQKVSKKSYEEFMREEVFKPLGLNHTHFYGNDEVKERMATGYKVGFLGVLKSNPPLYRGNNPAGYIISNISDMGKWLKINMGFINVPEPYASIIRQSHIPHGTYSAGWFTGLNKGTVISHGGSNPTFSSYLTFRPQDEIGVVVLSNRGSIGDGYTGWIGEGVLSILTGNEFYVSGNEQIIGIDTACTVIVLVFACFSLICLFFIIVTFIQIFKKQRKFCWRGRRSVIEIISPLLLMGLIGMCLYLVPDVFFGGYRWPFISVWGPVSIIYAVIAILAGSVLFYIYYLLKIFFIKKDEKPYFFLGVLSIACGMANGMTILIINLAVNSQSKHSLGMFVYFALSIILNVLVARVLKKKMIIITSDIVYNKRIQLIDNILKASYQKLERIDQGRIHSGLNNDTQVVSNFASMLIGGLTNAITLICCFAYLCILNVWGFLLSVLVILVAVGLYFYVSMEARKQWEKNRDTQNEFFNFINDLVSGFKELYINPRKNKEFKNDMKNSVALYRDKNNEGEFQFINVAAISELLFIFVIATAAFIFPVLFPLMGIENIRTYVFIFLYMTGPVHGLLGVIPGITRFQISWQRINEIINDISMLETGSTVAEGVSFKGKLSIRLKDVVYRYESEDCTQAFSVGPLNICFNSGEITFITGGNGSGKSTMAKLIAGLYVPDEGQVLVNNKHINPKQLSQYFSTIFSDYYLFGKLYGLDYENKTDEINKYLETLGIKDKVEINDGVFSTTKLSTGQRKRLALLVSIMENKSVYLFDELAADQDPEFRHYFYTELLPDMKSKGKCVIAITHDDRYYSFADKVIKMELGKVVNVVNVETSSGSQRSVSVMF